MKITNLRSKKNAYSNSGDFTENYYNHILREIMFKI